MVAPPKILRVQNDDEDTKIQIPSSVDDSLSSIINVNELHAGVLLDFLKKINNFNKKLLKGFVDLTNKYHQSIERKKDSEPEQITNNLDSHELTENDHHRQNEEFQMKLNEIEQRSNNNVLICNGDSIKNIITQSKTNSELKEKLVTSVGQISQNCLHDNIIQVQKFGKNNNSVKITCSNEFVKREIIIEAKKKRLPDVYCQEFLTRFRSKLFFEARQVKKLYPTKITTVYTRNGNVYYKIISSDDYIVIKKPHDLTLLRQKCDN